MFIIVSFHLGNKTPLNYRKARADYNNNHQKNERPTRRKTGTQNPGRAESHTTKKKVTKAPCVE